MKKSLITIGSITLLSIGSASMADNLTIPNEFVSGTPAVAADVNANFDAVESSVDDNDARITTNATAITGLQNDKLDAGGLGTALDTTTTTAGNSIDNNKGLIDSNTAGIANNATSISTKADATDVTTNSANIATNTSDITTNAANISTNTSDIATNAADISTNTSDIATNAADISTNTADIATNAANISTNTTNISGNTSDIADLLGGITGQPCSGNDANDEMVRVGPLCVDKYEASVWSTADGSASGIQYGDGTDDYPDSDPLSDNIGCNDNGNGCSGSAAISAGDIIYARSEAGVNPSVNITWFQAQQACANSGKRLLTNAEWQMAAAGTPDDATCTTGSLANTGANTGCVSNWQVNDMVGNVFEWVADWIQGTAAATSGTAGSIFGDDVMSTLQPAANQHPAGANMPAALKRGGAAASGTNGGVFAFTSSNAPGQEDSATGFRCAR